MGRRRQRHGLHGRKILHRPAAACLDQNFRRRPRSASMSAVWMRNRSRNWRNASMPSRTQLRRAAACSSSLVRQHGRPSPPWRRRSARASRRARRSWRSRPVLSAAALPMMPQPLPRPAFPWECCLFAMPTEVTIRSSIWRSRTCSRPHGCSRGGWQHTAPNDNNPHPASFRGADKSAMPTCRRARNP